MVVSDVVFNDVEISFDFDIGEIDCEVLDDKIDSDSVIVVNIGEHSGLKNHDAIEAH